MKRIVSMMLLCLLLIVPLLSASAEDSTIKQKDMGDRVTVVQTRLRDLGYLNYRPTGKFSDLTVEAVRKFQQQNGIDPDGQVGDDTFAALFSANVVRAPLNPQIKKIAGPSYSGKVTTHGELSSWEEINPLLPVGTEFSVQDYNSGLTFNLVRTGGVNSAQVVTPTAADHETYLQAFGGADTWEHRPVLVTIGGRVYAASLFGMPTGGADTTGSGMNGYTVLYFNNSKTDVNSLSDDEHILAIMKASGK